MAQFSAKVITPEKTILDKPVEMISISTSLGRIGILPHHANLMAKIVPGVLIIQDNGSAQVLAIGEGFLSMLEGKLTILTDLAKSPGEIDEALIREAHERALQALEHHLYDEEYATTMSVIEKSVAQLKIKVRHHKS